MPENPNDRTGGGKSHVLTHVAPAGAMIPVIRPSEPCGNSTRAGLPWNRRHPLLHSAAPSIMIILDVRGLMPVAEIMFVAAAATALVTSLPAGEDR